MPVCPHCKGTGEAPLKLKQECIGCQKSITVEFADCAEMIANDGRVWCAECKQHLKGDA